MKTLHIYHNLVDNISAEDVGIHHHYFTITAYDLAKYAVNNGCICIDMHDVKFVSFETDNIRYVKTNVPDEVKTMYGTCDTYDWVDVFTILEKYGIRAIKYQGHKMVINTDDYLTKVVEGKYKFTCKHHHSRETYEAIIGKIVRKAKDMAKGVDTYSIYNYGNVHDLGGDYKEDAYDERPAYSKDYAISYPVEKTAILSSSIENDKMIKLRLVDIPLIESEDYKHLGLRTLKGAYNQVGFAIYNHQLAYTVDKYGNIDHKIPEAFVGDGKMLSTYLPRRIDHVVATCCTAKGFVFKKSLYNKEQIKKCKEDYAIIGCKKVYRLKVEKPLKEFKISNIEKDMINYIYEYNVNHVQTRADIKGLVEYLPKQLNAVNEFNLAYIDKIIPVLKNYHIEGNFKFVSHNTSEYFTDTDKDRETRLSPAEENIWGVNEVNITLINSSSSDELNEALNDSTVDKITVTVVLKRY